MNFGIEIRNVDTGLAVTLDNAQAVADFLAAHPGETWEGYKCLGELPSPTPAVAEVPVMADADPDHGEPDIQTVTYSDGTQATGVAPLPENSPEHQAVLSQLAEGSSDTYLPVDQGAQS